MLCEMPVSSRRAPGARTTAVVAQSGARRHSIAAKGAPRRLRVLIGLFRHASALCVEQQKTKIKGSGLLPVSCCWEQDCEPSRLSEVTWLERQPASYGPLHDLLADQRIGASTKCEYGAKPTDNRAMSSAAIVLSCLASGME